MSHETCASCRMTVLPKPDGLCPICHRNVFGNFTPEKGTAYYRKDLRNVMFLMGFVAFLPSLMLLFMILSGEIAWISWDAITFAILGFSLSISALSFVSALLCGAGKRLGRSIAYIPTILFLIQFPIGTMIGVFVLRKLNSQSHIFSLDWQAKQSTFHCARSLIYRIYAITTNSLTEVGQHIPVDI